MTRAQIYYRLHREATLARSRRTYLRNKARVCQRSIAWHKANPFATRLSMILNGARARCRNPRHIAYPFYGGRGIDCTLTMDDMRLLWKRDDAETLQRPSLDRIDPLGSYTLTNCRFIELGVNIHRSNLLTPRKGRVGAPRDCHGRFRAD